MGGSSGRSEQDEFKRSLSGLKRKPDEENFDEAIAQAYQVWAETGVSMRSKATKITALIVRSPPNCRDYSMRLASWHFPEM